MQLQVPELLSKAGTPMEFKEVSLYTLVTVSMVIVSMMVYNPSSIDLLSQAKDKEIRELWKVGPMHI